jgi:hypothetical protein
MLKVAADLVYTVVLLSETERLEIPPGVNP